MDVVKNFFGWGVCFALAYAVIVSWPLLERMGNWLDGTVQNVDLGLEMAAYKRDMRRSGLDDDMIDSTRSDAGFLREHAELKNAGALASPGCEWVDGEQWCRTRRYEHGCWYDEQIHQFWCPRR